MSEHKENSSENFPVSVKIAWLVTLFGALGITWLSGAWAMETVSYGRFFFQKIHAGLILLTSLTFIFYCFGLLKGFRAGQFKTGAIQFLEMAAYCFFVVSLLVTLIMFAELLSSDKGDFEGGFESLFFPLLIALIAFVGSLIYVMRKRRNIPIAGTEHVPSRWSPLWFVALLIILILFLYTITGLSFLISEDGLLSRSTAYGGGVLMLGIGYLTYLFSLRVHVADGKLGSYTPIMLEVFAYGVIALSLFEGLRKLPNIAANFSRHFSWTIGNRMDFIMTVRFLMPVLCLSLAIITIWLIRVRRRLPNEI